jgi:sulfur carrier protein ThiS
MIQVPVIGDEVVSVDEQIAALLARCRVAFVNVVVNGDAVPESEFNDLALSVPSALNVLEISAENGEGSTDSFDLFVPAWNVGRVA